MHSTQAPRSAPLLAASLLGAAGLAACNQDKLLTVPDPRRRAAAGHRQPRGAAERIRGGRSATSSSPTPAATAASAAARLQRGARADDRAVDRRAAQRGDVQHAHRGGPARDDEHQQHRRCRPSRTRSARAPPPISSRRATAIFDPANPQRAEAQALAAFMYVMFAEDYCNGVPTSRVLADGTFEYGAAAVGHAAAHDGGRQVRFGDHRRHGGGHRRQRRR